MVIQPARVIVHNQKERLAPLGAGSQCLVDVLLEHFTFGDIKTRVITCLPRRHDPAEGWKVAAGSLGVEFFL